MGFPQPIPDVPLVDTSNIIDMSAEVYGIDFVNQTSAAGLANLANIRRAMNDALPGATLLFPANSTCYIECDFVPDADGATYCLPVNKNLNFIGPPGCTTATLLFGPANPAQSINAYLKVYDVANCLVQDLNVTGMATNFASTGIQTQVGLSGNTLYTNRVRITNAQVCVKLDGGALFNNQLTTNRVYVCQDSYLYPFSNNTAHNVGIFAASGSIYLLRSKFDMPPGMTTLSHNLYLDYPTNLYAEDCLFLTAGGYNVHYNDGFTCTPEFISIRNCIFAGDVGLGCILGNPYTVGIPGGTNCIFDMQDCLFSPTSAPKAFAMVGYWRMLNCQITVPYAAISAAIGSTVVSSGRIEDCSIASQVFANTGKHSLVISKTRFIPGGGLVSSGVVRIFVGAPTSEITMEDCTFDGAGNLTRCCYIEGGRFTARRNTFLNRNNSTQLLTITGSPTGGTFTISYTDPQGRTTTTVPLAYNADPLTVSNAIAALPNVGTDNVIVTSKNPNTTNLGGLPATSYVVRFRNALGGSVQATMTCDSTLLTGGSTPTAAFTSVITGGAVTGIQVLNAGTFIDGEQNVFSNPANAFSVTSTPKGTLNVASSAGRLVGPLGTPTAPTVTTATTGGTLAAATYSYRVSALDAYGNESLPSAAGTVVTTGATSTAIVTFAQVSGSFGYRIYGRVGGSELFLAQVPFGSVSWTDTGALTPTGALPGVDSTNAVIASAATITWPVNEQACHISGTTTINTINVQASTAMPLLIGTQIRLIFDGLGVLGTAGNIAVAYTAPAVGSIRTLVWDGVKWQG